MTCQFIKDHSSNSSTKNDEVNNYKPKGPLNLVDDYKSSIPLLLSTYFFL